MPSMMGWLKGIPLSLNEVVSGQGSRGCRQIPSCVWIEIAEKTDSRDETISRTQFPAAIKRHTKQED